MLGAKAARRLGIHSVRDLVQVYVSGRLLTVVGILVVPRVGAVALLVGGIGIANVMIISVLERRSEVGLRRALGARRRHIAVQFLGESLVLGAFGGVAGVLLGICVAGGYAGLEGLTPLVPAPLGAARRPSTCFNARMFALRTDEEGGKVWKSRAFARHYAEMSLVMLVGMGVLAVPARLATSAIWPGVEVNDPGLMVARMAVIMTAPMVAWMAWRGHAWRPCAEMAAAMIVPATVTLALLGAGLVEGVAALMTIEHVGMFAAMFGVMAARPEEYAGSACAEAEAPARPAG